VAFHWPDTEWGNRDTAVFTTYSGMLEGPGNFLALERPSRWADWARFLTTPSSSIRCHWTTTSLVPCLMRWFVSRWRSWTRLGRWHVKLNWMVLWETSVGSQINDISDS
jgi:hypothetical protein